MNYALLLPLLLKSPLQRDAFGRIGGGGKIKSPMRGYYRGVLWRPIDYLPYYHPFMFGGGYIITRDIVPFISIGTLYLDLLWPGVEDVMIGEIISKAGFKMRYVPNVNVD